VQYDLQTGEVQGAGVWPVLVAPQLPVLHLFGEDYDCGTVLFPYHPPEIMDGVWQWALGGNVGPQPVIALQDRKWLI